MKVYKIFYILLALWPAGFLLSFLTRKLTLKLCDKKEGIISPESLNADRAAIASSFRHFKVSFIIYMLMIALGVFQPIKEFKWIFFAMGGMLVAPVFYDVFYINNHAFKQSKVRFLNSIPPLINLALEFYTLFCYYFAYIEMKNLR